MQQCVKIPFTAMNAAGAGSAEGGNPCYWKNAVQQTDESDDDWRKDVRFKVRPC